MTEPATYVAALLDLTVWFHGDRAAGEWLLSGADRDVAGNGSLSGQVRDRHRRGLCLALTPKG